MRGRARKSPFDVSAFRARLEGTDRRSRRGGGGAPTLANVHARAPPAGSFAVTSPPEPPCGSLTATTPVATPIHSSADGHDTPLCELPGGDWSKPVGVMTLQIGSGPCGWVERITFPAWSVATHSDVDGQDWLSSPPHPLLGLQAAFRVSTLLGCHVAAPAVGVLEVNPYPLASTARHSDADA